MDTKSPYYMAGSACKLPKNSDKFFPVKLHQDIHPAITTHAIAGYMTTADLAASVSGFLNESVRVNAENDIKPQCDAPCCDFERHRRGIPLYASELDTFQLLGRVLLKEGLVKDPEYLRGENVQSMVAKLASYFEPETSAIANPAGSPTTYVLCLTSVTRNGEDTLYAMKNFGITRFEAQATRFEFKEDAEAYAKSENFGEGWEVVPATAFNSVALTPEELHRIFYRLGLPEDKEKSVLEGINSKLRTKVCPDCGNVPRARDGNKKKASESPTSVADNLDNQWRWQVETLLGNQGIRVSQNFVGPGVRPTHPPIHYMGAETVLKYMKSLAGRLLTVIDATFSDTTQREALKSIIRREVRASLRNAFDFFNGPATIPPELREDETDPQI
jgi:hypothetical protein